MKKSYSKSENVKQNQLNNNSIKKSKKEYQQIFLHSAI